MARGRDRARAELVAALGRDRSDRGLAEARDHAGAVQVFVSTSVDPRRWRSAAELDRAEARARAELAMASRPSFAGLDEVPQRDRADREAAAQARQAAERHRRAAEAEQARLPGAEREALADMAAARQDARVAEKVEAARARLEELRARWGAWQLPGPTWSDEAVFALAGELARAEVARAGRAHLDEARAALEEAARREQAVAGRRAWAASVAGIEAAHQARQGPLVDAANRALEEVKRARAERARLTELMSPGAVRAADRARDAYLERERHRALFERPLGRSPGRGREGPGLDL